MATITKPEALTDEQIAGMNVAQLRTEIKSHFERAAEIEKQHPKGYTDADAEDETELKRLLSTIDKMEDRLQPLEDADARKQRILKGAQDYSRAVSGHRHPAADAEVERFLKSPGEQFIDSPEFKALIERGTLKNPTSRVPEFTVPMQKGESFLQYKAIVNSATGSGGGFIQPNRIPGLRVPLLQREMTVIDLIPRSGTDSDTVEYVREDTFTNASVPVAEATATTGTSGLKPESTFAFSKQTSPVRTVAHWVPVTNKMLADAPQMRGIIDNRLLLGLDLTLESQIITGDGSGENLTGILSATGLQIQGVGADPVQDAILKAMTLVRVNGKSQPTAIVMHPNDFQAVRLARENAATGTLGGYLMGPPSQQGPMTLWGRPVVESLGITENTRLVGDFAMGAMLFDREEAQIRVGYIDDQFVRNMVTVLAELRAAFVVWRGAAFAKVTGV